MPRDNTLPFPIHYLRTVSNLAINIFRSGVPLLSSDSLLSFRRKSQGGVCLPKISSWGRVGLPVGPEIGTEGTVLENFGKFSKKNCLEMQ